MQANQPARTIGRWLTCSTWRLSAMRTAINAQRRVLVSLGLERRARDVGKSLGEVLRNGNRNEATP
jgi:hypothetical protein